MIVRVALGSSAGAWQLRSAEARKLNKDIDFTTGAAGYTAEQITLNSVFAGNVTASRVPADKFPAP